MTANHEDELAALRARRMKEIQDQIQAQATQQLKAEEQAQQDAAQAANVDAVLRRLSLIHISEPTRLV